MVKLICARSGGEWLQEPDVARQTVCHCQQHTSSSDQTHTCRTATVPRPALRREAHAQDYVSLSSVYGLCVVCSIFKI